MSDEKLEETVTAKKFVLMRDDNKTIAAELKTKDKNVVLTIFDKNGLPGVKLISDGIDIKEFPPSLLM